MQNKHESRLFLSVQFLFQFFLKEDIGYAENQTWV